MKKALSLVMLGILLLLVLSACGQTSQQDVNAALKKKLENLKGYKAEATMTLYAGDKPSTYDVDIWYKKPDFYRIHLKNAKQQLSQMILKNNEGVFVLTPQLNKSYRFQSDWPKNGSQWYLYESLLKDILNDPEPSFERGDNGNYVFKTKTNYKHSDLKTQEIVLSQKDLKPLRVKIMNDQNKTIVDMKFKNMNFNTNFDDGAFDLRKNMTGAKMKSAPKAEKTTAKSFQVLYPEQLPKGTKLTAKKVDTNNGKEYVLQYSGKQPFTLIEQKSKAWTDTVEPATVSGTPVNLGFAIGHLTDHSVSWTYEGTEFFLASKKMNQTQLADLARTVLGQSHK